MIRYARWVFIRRYDGLRDAKGASATIKNIQMTKIEHGLETALMHHGQMTVIRGTQEEGLVFRKVDLLMLPWGLAHVSPLTNHQLGKEHKDL